MIRTVFKNWRINPNVRRWNLCSRRLGLICRNAWCYGEKHSTISKGVMSNPLGINIIFPSADLPAKERGEKDTVGRETQKSPEYLWLCHKPTKRYRDAIYVKQLLRYHWLKLCRCYNKTVYLQSTLFMYENAAALNAANTACWRGGGLFASMFENKIWISAMK